MTISVGIVGLPNVGKSTLFQALTKKKVDTANYPFCTVDPNIGIVKVPDERLQKLADFFESKKVIPTIVEFVDIAGLVKGANKGEGLGNQFLSNIREVDAIVQVVRCFENANITHVDETIDPLRDIDTIQTELLLKDLETLQKRVSSLEKDVRSKNKEAIAAQETLQALLRAMNEGVTAFQFIKENPKSAEIIKELSLLTAKPTVFLFNSDSEKAAVKVIGKAKSLGAPYVVLDIKEEFDAAGLSPDEAKELGVNPPRLPELITKAYQALNLITFLTTGPDETRAWTVVKGSLAPDAGGVIHSDFKDKFIRATVIQWDKLLESGGMAEAVAAGQLRTEGKDYVVKDGDVIEIKHG